MVNFLRKDEEMNKDLLLALALGGSGGGGGGGGTTNYNALSNKPKINGVTLTGDLSGDDLGLSGGGNANFDIGTVPLGGAGVYEVNAFLSNNDSERVRATYSRGVNGELPDWFSMSVTSGLGTDYFHIATKEYADGLVANKVEAVVIDVANFNMRMNDFVTLFYSDKLIYIKDGYLNHLVTDKYTWDLMPETAYELSYIEGNISYTYQFETSDDIYYRGRTVKPVGYNLAVDEERLIGTYREAGINYNVYSKVIKINALPSAAGTTTYDHGITGIKQILQVYGFCSNGFVMNAPRQSLQDNISVYQVSKSTGNEKISIEVGKDRSSLSAYVCLVYAKNK